MGPSEMSKPREFTFVVAVNNRDVFETHFLASPCLGAPHAHEVLVQEGFKSASQAYNDAIDRARNDFIVFVHQDVILPERWLDQLESSLDYLEENDPQWGVLGCYGETRSQGGRGYVYSSGLGIIGQASEHPMPVQTLDEIVLVLRKSSGLRFDGNLPHFHLYGTDICLRAEQLGRKNYALSAFCIHNTNQGYVLPKEFYECYWRIRAPGNRSCRFKLPASGSRGPTCCFTSESCRRFISARCEGVSVARFDPMMCRVCSKRSIGCCGKTQPWIARTA